MTPKERAAYFGHLWPAAALANEWDVKDDAKRRAVTVDCMRAIRAKVTDSTSSLGRDEVTALFTYLLHLADPSSLDKSARWVTCQEDYRTFSRAKQADWHERELYGNGKNKLDRDRFAGATSAAGGPLETLDEDEVRKRHITMASRHQKKLRREGIFRPKGGGQHAPVVTATKPATPQNSPAPATSGAGHSGLSEDEPF